MFEEINVSLWWNTHTQGNVTLQSRGVGMVAFKVSLPQIRITCVGRLPEDCPDCRDWARSPSPSVWGVADGRPSPFALLGCVPSCLPAVLLWRPLISLLPSEPACAGPRTSGCPGIFHDFSTDWDYWGTQPGDPSHCQIVNHFSWVSHCGTTPATEVPSFKDWVSSRFSASQVWDKWFSNIDLSL